MTKARLRIYFSSIFRLITVEIQCFCATLLLIISGLFVVCLFVVCWLLLVVVVLFVVVVFLFIGVCLLFIDKGVCKSRSSSLYVALGFDLQTKVLALRKCWCSPTTR